MKFGCHSLRRCVSSIPCKPSPNWRLASYFSGAGMTNEFCWRSEVLIMLTMDDIALQLGFSSAPQPTNLVESSLLAHSLVSLWKPRASLLKHQHIILNHLQALFVEKNRGHYDMAVANQGVRIYIGHCRCIGGGRAISSWLGSLLSSCQNQMHKMSCTLYLYR